MIGKTRQSRVEESFDPGLESARGLLRWPPREGEFRRVRRQPPSDLEPWIDCYWMVNWDLPQPYLQETLPHPNVHLVFEDGKCAVRGTSTGRFSRVLEGKSGVFGVRFRPGGFRPFVKGPVAALQDRVVPAARIFGPDADALGSTMESLAWDVDRMIDAESAFFRARLPKPDRKIALADGIVRLILEERGIRTADDLLARAGMEKRTLQRLFREYVGVSPKWVIRRFRLHELIEVLHAGGRPDWAQLALELGYFDQAHLINDFRSIVGYTPARH